MLLILLCSSSSPSYYEGVAQHCQTSFFLSLMPTTIAAPINITIPITIPRSSPPEFPEPEGETTGVVVLGTRPGWLSSGTGSITAGLLGGTPFDWNCV